jgi:divalent metal cation (Fe/Co/Zn/Cd) transporter
MTAKEVHDLFLQIQDRVRGIVGKSAKVLMHADPLGG